MASPEASLAHMNMETQQHAYESSLSPEHEASVPLPDDTAMPEASMPGEQEAIMASVHLTPDMAAQSENLKVVMMLKATLIRPGQRARKGARQTVNLIVDTGSTRSFVSDRLHKQVAELQQSNMRVTLADGTSRVNVPSCMAEITLDGYKFKQQAFHMSLPADFDIILGQDWIMAHGADLMYSTMQLQFKELHAGKQHVCPVPPHLKD